MTTPDDVVAHDGALSLREAFAAANGDGTNSLILLGAGLTYVLDLCAPTPAHTSNAAGSLVHTAQFTLLLEGNGSTVRQTCPEERVMRNSDESAWIGLVDLTLTGGRVTETAVDELGVEIGGGGGLLSFGPVLLEDVVLTDNTSLQGGGGLRAIGETIVERTVITENAASVGAGGAEVGGGLSDFPPHLTMTDSLVADNEPIGVFLRFGTNRIAASIIRDHVGSGIFADHGINIVEETEIVDNGGGGLVGIDSRFEVADSIIARNVGDGVGTTGAGLLAVDDSIVSENGGDALLFSGCNASESRTNVEVVGTALVGNGGLGVHHAGCGFTAVMASEVSENAGGLRCIACEAMTVAQSVIAGNSPSSGIHFRPGWEGMGGELVVRATQLVGNASDGDGGGIAALEGFGEVSTLVTVLDGSTIASNHASGRGGGIYVEGTAALFDSSVSENHAFGGDDGIPAGHGGGIYVTQGHLSVNFTTVSANVAEGSGGGVAHEAFAGDQLGFLHANVIDNLAKGSGGGVLANRSAQVVVSQSTLRGNTAVAPGGGFAGLDAAAMFLVTTVADNVSSGVGGGIYYRDSVLPGDPLIVQYSTISDNAAPDGAGIFADIRPPAEVALTNSTVSGNEGSGVRAALTTPITLDSSTVLANEPHNLHLESGLLTTTQSIIASAIDGTDCVVTLATSLGYNFSGDGTCGLGLGEGDVSSGGDPGLSSLQDHGGPTLTHLPLFGSPVLSLVPPSQCSQPNDQRFHARPAGPGCEPGAVEVGFDLTD